MCVHYTALNFIYYLQNNIIGNSAQIEVNINGEMKSFKAVDDNYSTYKKTTFLACQLISFKNK